MITRKRVLSPGEEAAMTPFFESVQRDSEREIIKSVTVYEEAFISNDKLTVGGISVVFDPKAKLSESECWNRFFAQRPLFAKRLFLKFNKEMNDEMLADLKDKLISLRTAVQDKLEKESPDRVALHSCRELSPEGDALGNPTYRTIAYCTIDYHRHNGVFEKEDMTFLDAYNEQQKKFPSDDAGWKRWVDEYLGKCSIVSSLDYDSFMYFTIRKSKKNEEIVFLSRVSMTKEATYPVFLSHAGSSSIVTVKDVFSCVPLTRRVNFTLCEPFCKRDIDMLSEYNFCGSIFRVYPYFSALFYDRKIGPTENIATLIYAVHAECTFSLKYRISLGKGEVEVSYTDPKLLEYVCDIVRKKTHVSAREFFGCQKDTTGEVYYLAPDLEDETPCEFVTK